MPDLFTDQLSAYLDSELDELRRRRLETHLGECAECRAVLGDLRALIAAAPNYRGREPLRDLWPAIEAGLEELGILPITPAGPPAGPPTRFSWPQLIAASLLMAAIGGGAAWLALRGPSDRPAGATALAPDGPTIPRSIAYAEAQYDVAVADLTSIVEEGRSRLDTATVRVIDESLRKIDLALAEARAAIQRDSTNVYLNRQVAANMRRKLTLLRRAADAIART
ncbi:MAG TPA: zf-HC2 domain-containing protein [Gemmatimonadales bacterium]|nr:zf-HC2 domain-containing protein [Gemmatimonadales bacterium]